MPRIRFRWKLLLVKMLPLRDVGTDSSLSSRFVCIHVDVSTTQIFASLNGHIKQEHNYMLL
jgi:hypothetical protein